MKLISIDGALLTHFFNLAGKQNNNAEVSDAFDFASCGSQRAA